MLRKTIRVDDHASGPTNRTIRFDELEFAVGFQEVRRWMAVRAHWPSALFNRLGGRQQRPQHLHEWVRPPHPWLGGFLSTVNLQMATMPIAVSQIAARGAADGSGLGGLAPMLFDDTDKETAEALRASVVAQAQRSPAAVQKQTTGLTEDGMPVHSFRTLLADLATVARDTVTTAITPNYPLSVVTRPTAIQHKALQLLGVSCSQ
jgi:hypothetical protein